MFEFDRNQAGPKLLPYCWHLIVNDDYLICKVDPKNREYKRFLKHPSKKKIFEGFQKSTAQFRVRSSSDAVIF